MAEDFLAAPIPADEAGRVRALHEYGVLDTEAEEAFDDQVLLAAQLCQTPIALISLVDSERQWFKARVGLETRETPRHISFCGHAILRDELFVVEDAARDPRFRGNPLVCGGPRLRFYAGAPLTTHSGHRVGTLCVLDQLPRRLDAEQSRGLRALARQVVAALELRRSKTLLQRRDMRRSQLFSVVSHDLRTAFTALIGNLGMLEVDFKAMSASAIRACTAKARRQARDALDIAEDLLAWAQAELGTAQFNPSLLHAFAELRRCVELLEALAEEKSIRLELVCPQELRVYADPTLLASMVRNVLVNAIKFSPSNASVTIEARDHDAGAVIEVKDCGVGMAAAQIAALEKSEALATTPGTAGEKGIGLGLLTTKHFAARHGGTVEIASEPGVGTQVRLWLPAPPCVPSNP